MYFQLKLLIIDPQIDLTEFCFVLNLYRGYIKKCGFVNFSKVVLELCRVVLGLGVVFYTLKSSTSNFIFRL